MMEVLVAVVAMMEVLVAVAMMMEVLEPARQSILRQFVAACV